MPGPRLIGSKKVWSSRELEDAFNSLPLAFPEQQEANDWDEV